MANIQHWWDSKLVMLATYVSPRDKFRLVSLLSLSVGHFLHNTPTEDIYRVWQHP